MWGNIEKVDKRRAFEWHVHMQETRPEIFIVPFPKSLISDSFDQEAILAHRGCNSAVEVLGPVLGRMLEGTSLASLHHSGYPYLIVQYIY